MASHPHPPQNHNRFAQLLDALKAEHDRVVSENNTFKTLRTEWTRKFDAHASELSAMLAQFHDLERKHLMLKERYEAEITRLKQNPSDLANRPADPIPPLPHLSPAVTKLDPNRDPLRPPTSTNPDNPNASNNIATTTATTTTTNTNIPNSNNTKTPGTSSTPNANNPNPSAASAVPTAQQQHQQQPSSAQPALPSLFPSNTNPAHANSSISQLNMPSQSQSQQPQQPQQALSLPPTNHAQPLPAASSALIGRHQPEHPMHRDQHMLPPQSYRRVPPSHPTHNIPSHISALPASNPSAKSHPNSMGNNPNGTMALQSQQQHHQLQQQQQNMAPTNHGDDCMVFQGRAANGNMSNMNLKAQHSLQLESVVCCVRYSWDGQYLATGSNRCAHIFEASSGRPVATFSKEMDSESEDHPGVDSYVRAVCFSPDGKWLVTGAEDHIVKVWDVRARKVKHRLIGHETDIYSVDASKDGRFIISGSGDKKAKLWNLESGKLLSTLGTEEGGPTDGITSVAVSPTSQLVAAGSLDKTVRVWDVESKRLVRSFDGHEDSVYSVAFSPDRRVLLSGSLDKTLKLWDLSSGERGNQCRMTFRGHKDFVLSVAFSPDGRWLISGSKDRTVQFWDPRQPSMCLMLQGHKNSVISIAHSPITNAVATGSGDCRARTWVYE